MLYMQVRFGQLCQQVLLTKIAPCLWGPCLCPLHVSHNLKSRGAPHKAEGCKLKALKIFLGSMQFTSTAPGHKLPLRP